MSYYYFYPTATELRYLSNFGLFLRHELVFFDRWYRMKRKIEKISARSRITKMIDHRCDLSSKF